MPRPRPTAGPSGSSTQFELVVKYPGFWKTRFKDSYWSVPASEISKRAEQEKKLATTAMGLSELPGGEKDRLNDAIRNFNELTSDYQSAVRAKDKESAQKYVKGMEDSIRALNKAHTHATSVARTIVLHRAEQNKIKEAYTFISSKTKDDIILTSPRRKVLSNRAVIPPEVALHTMAWLNENHLTKRIHWLRGPSRCGKSTILHRMATMVQTMAKATGLTPAWIAGIAFDKPCDNDTFVTHFLCTVIHQIAERFDTAKQEFAKISACWDRETYFRETEFGEQVDDIFIALASVIPRGGHSPIIIILDGLDNCDPVALDKVFEFIRKTLDSPLPIYFVIAACDVGRPQGYLTRAPSRAWWTSTMSPISDT
ncbi:hypothetical protein NMY22_g9373 [Coprinellus aureogranulatus]|nr:hypothetical protein NMY22_g9373 [Coprinellus aureogranulatus]